MGHLGRGRLKPSAEWLPESLDIIAHLRELAR
jgi:hypothetical protein